MIFIAVISLVAACKSAPPTPTPVPPTNPPVYPTSVPPEVPTQVPPPVYPTQPAPPAQPTSAPAASCSVIHDYDLLPGMTEVATHSESGYFLHVEFWWEGQPEREVILTGGRYTLERDLHGHIWEYSGCTINQVQTQVNANIQRRLAQKANNAGWADMNLVNQLFRQAS